MPPRADAQHDRDRRVNQRVVALPDLLYVFKGDRYLETATKR